MLMKNFLRCSLSLLLAASILLLTGCDEGKVRQLGAKVGARGQDVGNAAAKVIGDLAALEAVDYDQRLRVEIMALPEGYPNLPQVQHNDQLLPEMANRVRLYKQLAKAYAALATLSQSAFADQYTEAANELNASIKAIKQIPAPPAGLSSVLIGLGGIAVEMKQAKDIRKHSETMARLITAYKGLWALDRPVWDKYLRRISNAYITRLNTIPASRFDEAQLRKTVTLPVTKPYLVNAYKAQEASRINAEVAKMQDDFDAVEDAFAQLERAHKELTEEQPSYTDVIASLDRIVIILKDLT